MKNKKHGLTAEQVRRARRNREGISFQEYPRYYRQLAQQWGISSKEVRKVLSPPSSPGVRPSARLAQKVIVARASGASWTQVANVLNISASYARERYGHACEEAGVKSRVPLRKDSPECQHSLEELREARWGTRVT